MINYHKWLHLKVMLMSFLLLRIILSMSINCMLVHVWDTLGWKKCLFHLGTLVVCIKEVDITNNCKKKKNKRDNLRSEAKRNLTLGKKQMEENLGKNICRMKYRGWPATTFMPFLLYQMSNTLIQSSLHLASHKSDNRCVQLFSP